MKGMIFMARLKIRIKKSLLNKLEELFCRFLVLIFDLFFWLSTYNESSNKMRLYKRIEDNHILEDWARLSRAMGYEDVIYYIDF
jgi:hypothetical protein